MFKGLTAKKIYKFFEEILLIFLISAVFLCAFTTPAFADENYEKDKYGLYIRNNNSMYPSWYPVDGNAFKGYNDPDIPRVVDMADILSDEQEEALKSKIAEYSAIINKDIVIVTDNSSYYLGHERYCYDFYDYNGYGLGGTYEGICLFICMDPDNRGWWVGATGYETRDIYTEEVANRLDDDLYEYMVNHDYATGISKWIDNVYNTCSTYVAREPETLPDWFPENINEFISFHDDKCPRIVDFAGVLTDTQKEEISQKLALYKTKTNKDLVVVTDISDYNLKPDKYRDYFYECNGYGIGDEYEGMCLFVIAGDVSDFSSGAYGAETHLLYDKEKKQFETYLKSGFQNRRYYEGINEWMDMVYNMYLKGYALAPDWYPTLKEKENFVRTHNTEVSRVIDSCSGDGLFTSEQEEELNAKIKEISDKYGVDVIINTTENFCGMESDEYIEALYNYNGYGLGDDYNAIILCLTKYYENVYINTYGKIADELSEVNYTRMQEQSQDIKNSGSYFRSAEAFLENVEHFERTGRVSRTLGQWVFAGVITALVGWLFGRHALKKAKKTMVTVRSEYGADNYVCGSDSFSQGTDTFISRDVRKVKIPRTTYSSSSSSRSSHSSSRRSSYHSSSRGSSGRSHSGSGRRF